jgi:hypothetical protein
MVPSLVDRRANRGNPELVGTGAAPHGPKDMRSKRGPRRRPERGSLAGRRDKRATDRYRMAATPATAAAR